MPTTILGRIGMAHKGTYNAATTYSKLDVVYYNGSTYVALQTVTGVTPSDDGTYWKMAAQGCSAVIADAYDSTATYAVGDYCTYEGNLYICITAITTAEAWTAAHWEQKTFAEELKKFGAMVGDTSRQSITPVYEDYVGKRVENNGYITSNDNFSLSNFIEIQTGWTKIRLTNRIYNPYMMAVTFWTTNVLTRLNIVSGYHIDTDIRPGYVDVDIPEEANYITIGSNTSAGGGQYTGDTYSVLIAATVNERIASAVQVKLDKTAVKTVTGTSDTDVMSQKAVTDALNTYNNGLLAYNPLTKLSAGYMALTCDDGRNELATTTIPLIKSYVTQYGTNIPITMALIYNANSQYRSEVFNTAAYKALVEEMVSDYGCDVAVHGGEVWTNMDKGALYEFLEDSRDNLATLTGITPQSAIYPGHDYDVVSEYIVGKVFGIGATGNAVEYQYQTVHNGFKSNRNTLRRFNLIASDLTTATIKSYIDYAVANNTLLIPFWHDYSLTSTNIELIKYCIEYGHSAGIHFIKLSDVKNL